MPKMTRAHFKLIAATIAGLDVDKRTRERIAGEFARELRATNPLFDAGRFVQACQPTSSQTRERETYARGGN